MVTNKGVEEVGKDFLVGELILVEKSYNSNRSYHLLEFVLLNILCLESPPNI